MRHPQRIRVLVALAAAAALSASSARADPVAVQVAVDPVEATVGDRLAVRVEVTLEEGVGLDPPQFGPSLGPFSVVDGGWSGPESLDEGGERWVWKGFVATFRPGDVELPGFRVEVQTPDGQKHEARSEPVAVTIASVLDPATSVEEQSEIADLKGPASLAPDYGPLWTGLGVFALLLAVAGVLWWLHRRYAAKLSAVPVPDDPFHRTPPHEWVYAELQQLLERRLAEQGQVTLFFAELSRILKRYLGGRYRVELMEQTTEDVPPRLRQAGAEPDTALEVAEMLGRCDMVKFAKDLPGSDDCRAAIEAAYRIVDATKPRVVTPQAESA